MHVHVVQRWMRKLVTYEHNTSKGKTYSYVWTYIELINKALLINQECLAVRSGRNVVEFCLKVGPKLGSKYNRLKAKEINPQHEKGIAM